MEINYVFFVEDIMTYHFSGNFVELIHQNMSYMLQLVIMLYLDDIGKGKHP